MIIKVIFTQPTESVPVNNQKELNSYLHRSIGHNKYHDAYSDYSVSSLQGGRLNGNGNLDFPENPYILIATQNNDFINDVMQGIQFGKETLFGMKFQRFDFADWNVHPSYDKVVTISPILLKRKDIKISFRDEGFIEYLNEQSRKKLEKCGIMDDTFRIELRTPEKAKVKKIMVGDTFNICSMMSLKIYGKKKTRKTLYNLGIGNSTGSGFGMVKIFD